MPYKPSHVANSFLVRANKEGIEIDHLKIQKLVYFFHGWFLAVRNDPGVGEYFEAWRYGPVLPSLYQAFKTNGSRPIEGYATDLDQETGEYRALMISSEDKRFTEVFEPVWERYKGLGGLQLSSLTHATGTPWRLARDRGDVYVSNEDIRTYFRDLVLAEKPSQAAS